MSSLQMEYERNEDELTRCTTHSGSLLSRYAIVKPKKVVRPNMCQENREAGG